METASFKELEAPSVLARIPKDHDGTIVVASAGNTGRAFAHICSKNRIPLLLVVPEESADRIWSVEPFREKVKLITPMVDSWNKGKDKIPLIDHETAKRKIDKPYAKVLTNRRPPYSIFSSLTLFKTRLLCYSFLIAIVALLGESVFHLSRSILFLIGFQEVDALYPQETEEPAWDYGNKGGKSL